MGFPAWNANDASKNRCSVELHSQHMQALATFQKNQGPQLDMFVCDLQKCPVKNSSPQNRHLASSPQQLLFQIVELFV